MIATPSPATDRSAESAGKFPPTVELILSALETGQHAHDERRTTCRAAYRTIATLRLYSDLPDTPPWTVYTRDANRRGLGFLTGHRLPLGYGGLLELQTPDGQFANIPCTLIRCRQAAPGWYEGSLHFNREQPQFASE